jgi:tRNA uridine 5-carboxymethylaminomethyl modification enzyme
LAELLRRAEIHLGSLGPWLEAELDSFSAEVREQVEIQIKYEGYITRQEEEIQRSERLQSLHLPENFRYEGIPGLSREVIEKLTRIRPHSLEQASRISGITPAAITLLAMHLKKHRTAESLPG